MELDKICRLCLTIKKDMSNLFANNILEMLNEFCNTIKVNSENLNYILWVNLIKCIVYRSSELMDGQKKYASNV